MRILKVIALIVLLASVVFVNTSYAEEKECDPGSWAEYTVKKLEEAISLSLPNVPEMPPSQEYTQGVVKRVFGIHQIGLQLTVTALSSEECAREIMEPVITYVSNEGDYGMFLVLFGNVPSQFQPVLMEYYSYRRETMLKLAIEAMAPYSTEEKASN